jgi:DNA-binding transcriptional regulator YhcF (GntR family)
MKYLSDYIQQPQTALFDELGAFFAFSNKQFDEAKKEGVKYVSLGMGMIVPTDNARELVTRLDEIQKEGIKQDIEENGKKAIIRRELFNHECFYTNDITDCVEKLEDYGYSYDDIYQVFNHIRKTEDVY